MPIITASQYNEAPLLAPGSWHVPPQTLTLEGDEVHVWRASLNLKASRLQSLQQTLSTDERSRAERFYFLQDRQHFIVARGLLRTILGRYLNLEPDQLRFCYDSYGKPSLATNCGVDALCFNLSHSGGFVLYAVSSGRKLGVDVERIRTDFAVEEIARQFFSPHENAALHQLPAIKRRAAFFACWTRKEAYIKAKGQGVTLRLDQFAVSLGPGEPAALLQTYGNAQEALRWSLQELSPGPGYAAALAVERHDWRLLHLFHFVDFTQD